MPDESLEGVDRTLLRAVLDRLLPAYDDLPGAGGMDLDDAVVTDATGWQPGRAALPRVLASLPDDFVDRDEPGQVAALRGVESQHGEAFGVVVNLAYNAYYTDERVRAMIERRTGYAARPPQPRGYELPPFDESVLERARTRAPFWRHVQ